MPGLSTLPVENNFQDRFEPNETFATASTVGLSPAAPKATVQSILDDYTLGPTSLVVIDTGTYASPVTITAADQGAAYAGSPGGSNFTYGGNRFELIDADSNEFYGLNFTGSGGTGFYAHPGPVANSRRNIFLNNTFTGATSRSASLAAIPTLFRPTPSPVAVPMGSICRR